MRARVIAALLATAMVVGAWVVREQVIEGGSDGRDRSGEQVAESRLVCAAELEDARACRGEEEPLGTTLDALVAAEDRGAAGLGAWVTPGPWGAMVDAGRDSAGRPPLKFETSVIASTDLVIVARKGANPCSADATWRCVADAAVGGVRVSAPATGTAVRLALRAATAGALIGRSDYITNDLQEGDVPDRIATFERAVDATRGFGGTTLEAFLVQSGAATVFVTTRADTIRAGIPSTYEVVAPTPAVRLDAVANYLREPADDEKDRLWNDLSDAGWNPPKRTGDDGLPSPGVLLALRDVV